MAFCGPITHIYTTSKPFFPEGFVVFVCFPCIAQRFRSVLVRFVCGVISWYTCTLLERALMFFFFVFFVRQAFLGFQAPWCIIAGGVMGWLLSDSVTSLGQLPFFPNEWRKRHNWKLRIGDWKKTKNQQKTGKIFVTYLSSLGCFVDLTRRSAWYFC